MLSILGRGSVSLWYLESCFCKECNGAYGDLVSFLLLLVISRGLLWMVIRPLKSRDAFCSSCFAPDCRADYICYFVIASVCHRNCYYFGFFFFGMNKDCHVLWWQNICVYGYFLFALYVAQVWLVFWSFWWNNLQIFLVLLHNWVWSLRLLKLNLLFELCRIVDCCNCNKTWGYIGYKFEEKVAAKYQ